MCSVNGNSHWFRMGEVGSGQELGVSVTFMGSCKRRKSLIGHGKIGRKKKHQGHNGMPQSLSRIGLTERLRIEILTNQASDCTNLTLHLLSNYWLKLKKTLMVLLSKNLWASHWWVPLTARTWKSQHPHDASRDRWFTPNLWPASSLSLSTCCGSQQTDCCWSK